MTRNGKIARLPAHLRDELNVRLENGQEGAPLLAWLHGQPQVQEILQDDFHGAPLTKQNLSQWRRGGFREWQMREELIEQASRRAEGAEALENAVSTALLPGALAAALAARYAALLNGWDGAPDPKFEEKARLLRGLNRDLALLQKTLHQAQRQKRESEQALAEEKKREEQELKESLVAPIWAKLEREQLQGILGGGDLGRRMAEVVTAVKYDLPKPHDWDVNLQALKDKALKAKEAKLKRSQARPVQPRRTRRPKSKAVQPNPAESSPDGPSPAQSNPVAPDLAEPGKSEPAPEERQNEGNEDTETHPKEQNVDLI